MKDRYAKLLLGEDMSGGGRGVSSALALSNAFTNLAGTFSLPLIFIYLKNIRIFDTVKDLLCDISAETIHGTD